jgi:hypothetical protein
VNERAAEVRALRRADAELEDEQRRRDREDAVAERLHAPGVVHGLER